MSESKRPDITGMHSYIFLAILVCRLSATLTISRMSHKQCTTQERMRYWSLFTHSLGIMTFCDIMEQSIKCLIETVALAKMQEERIDDDHRIEFPRPSKDYRSFASFLG